MRCGHCHDDHPTLAQVRSCAEADHRARASARAVDRSLFEDPVLTTREVLRQSVLIHPEWTLDTHYSYLVHDAFRSVTVEQVRSWLAEERG